MDLPEILQELTEVRPGERLVDVLTARRITAWQEGLRLLLSGGGLMEGAGISLNPAGAYGTVISVREGPRVGGGGRRGPCPFGELVPVAGGGRAIRGGLVHCGDQTWDMEAEGIDLTVDGVWRVYLAVEVEVNQDDDGEILLPGVLTGTRPSGAWGRTEDEDYPAHELPEAGSGEGTVILPIGKLTVADDQAKLEATGCGHFTVTHCAGSLGYFRT
jgi:hypothetical protein